MHSMWYAVCSIQCAMQCTINSIHCTACSVHCTSFEVRHAYVQVICVNASHTYENPLVWFHDSKNASSRVSFRRILARSQLIIGKLFANQNRTRRFVKWICIILYIVQNNSKYLIRTQHPYKNYGWYPYTNYGWYPYENYGQPIVIISIVNTLEYIILNYLRQSSHKTANVSTVHHMS